MKCQAPKCNKELPEGKELYCDEKCAKSAQNFRYNQKKKAQTYKHLSQAERIIRLFHDLGGAMTPLDVNSMLPDLLLTSVRRSLSNLKNKRVLIRTSEKRMEKYGKENYLYILNPDHPINNSSKQQERN